MESVTEGGEHGGLQRWQLTIVRLAKAKESCFLNVSPTVDVGLFLLKRILMDIVYEAAAKYVALECCKYVFVLSQKRKNIVVRVDFKDEDFFHLAGLQYLTDIDIPQNRKKTLNSILFEKNLTEDFLHKSEIYRNPKPDKNIPGRIDHLRFLEEYLDTDNIIKIFTLRNQGKKASFIRADYVIESSFNRSKDTVYIFLKRRAEDSEYYGIVSFFPKDKAIYSGDILYWMEKKKILRNKTKILFRHKNYRESDYS